MENKIIDTELENVSGGATYYNDGDYYVIKRGDTLSAIAAKFGTSIEKLMSLNPQIKNANLIYEGHTIRIR